MTFSEKLFFAAAEGRVGRGDHVHRPVRGHHRQLLPPRHLVLTPRLQDRQHHAQLLTEGTYSSGTPTSFTKPPVPCRYTSGTSTHLQTVSTMHNFSQKVRTHLVPPPHLQNPQHHAQLFSEGMYMSVKPTASAKPSASCTTFLRGTYPSGTSIRLQNRHYHAQLLSDGTMNTKTQFLQNQSQFLSL